MSLGADACRHQGWYSLRVVLFVRYLRPSFSYVRGNMLPDAAFTSDLYFRTGVPLGAPRQVMTLHPYPSYWVLILLSPRAESGSSETRMAVSPEVSSAYDDSPGQNYINTT